MFNIEFTKIREQHDWLCYFHLYKEFNIPAPYGPAESSKHVLPREEQKQGVQHKHAIAPCTKHHLWAL